MCYFLAYIQKKHRKVSLRYRSRILEAEREMSEPSHHESGSGSDHGGKTSGHDEHATSIPKRNAFMESLYKLTNILDTPVTLFRGSDF